jgi:1,4-alpha-glucan branching enzyme
MRPTSGTSPPAPADTDTFRLTDAEVLAVVEGRHGNPFAVLGPHAAQRAWAVRAYVPGAEAVTAVAPDGTVLGSLAQRHPAGFFEGVVQARARPRYRLRCARGSDRWELDDPYAFGPVLGAMDDWLMGEGTHARLYDRLGAHLIEHEGVTGVHFAVWAPNASRVSVVGEFNAWDGRCHPMRKRVDTGVWEIFLPHVGEGALYKYEILGPGGELQPLKADPVGFGAELRPSTASVVRRTDQFPWTDGAWMAERARAHWRSKPVAIYEVHAGSWQRGPDGRFLTYDELAASLPGYVADLGFTHIELMPITEHPLDASWGYQPIGLYAPTSRHGDPAAFARFVDACHAKGLGVILDWVPAHFPTDPHGLARFDGTPLYEHADPRLGFHPDWSTAIYDFGRTEVANYLIANALFWLDRYHLDGLRVDAVASMLYLDYSRKEGEWRPNVHGGRENLEAIAFLRRLNTAVYAHCPGAFTVAEESTAWPGVSLPAYAGGLGFGFKWNMGWMHDTLAYLGHEPVHRRWHHSLLTFGLLYAFAENFVLPLSHDEVVHGKGTLIARVPGDAWQKFATLRAAYAMMWGYPGKKLLFMGQEFAQGREWSEARALDWSEADVPWHRGVRDVVRDCNRGYAQQRALHERDCDPEGFRWIVVNDADQSVYAWWREGGQDAPPVVVVSNFTPVPRHGYRIGLPRPGRWREIVNTDAHEYGGSGLGNQGRIDAESVGSHGHPQSAALTLPPLATLWLVHEGN